MEVRIGSSDLTRSLHHLCTVNRGISEDQLSPECEHKSASLKRTSGWHEKNDIVPKHLGIECKRDAHVTRGLFDENCFSRRDEAPLFRIFNHPIRCSVLHRASWAHELQFYGYLARKSGRNSIEHHQGSVTDSSSSIRKDAIHYYMHAIHS
ncbi:hypothetical protein PMAYCL1PPCAC_21352 [Pristionchus mayeri]|uniref:Uncharacterized protein n=1 Tax=Pristionchus mayeri TaxID=1317129 RepID=A0AAN5CW60_9BILA|nr:hypothetical protein PMAYCL1PPCAC_21349 [Pristionchus mayeri]GMR51157.1 hypothetical protein PMAYCL1PPCAC_21352 [Pristionchus mayeri]